MRKPAGMIALGLVLGMMGMPCPVLAQEGAVVRNLGAGSARFVENWLVYGVWETFAGEDLNGDGDTEDSVLHVDNLTRGESTNLGLAGIVIEAAGERLVLWVSEPGQGEDLNGDGDTEDRVLHVHDLATGETRNLRLAASAVAEISGERLVLRVSEPEQGEDLNGDGDTEDTVLHVHDLATGETRNLRLAALGVIEISGDWLVFGAYGDGGIGGSQVLHVHNLATGETTNLGLRNAVGLILGESLVLSVGESAQGEDLNGDGDTEDCCVLHVHNLATGETTNLGASALSPTAFGANQLIYSVSETFAGKDLNGDGDTEDGVVHVRDLATGETTNLRLAGGVLHGGSFAYAPPVPLVIELAGDSCVLWSEGRVHVYNLATRETTDLGLELQGRVREVAADGVVFEIVSELDQGEDLNGDGDAQDYNVARVHNLTTRATTNLQLVVTWWGLELVYLLSGDWLVLGVDEPGQGQDLNGDGDMEDSIWHVHDSLTGETRNLRLPAFLPWGVSAELLEPPRRSGDWLLLEVSESGWERDFFGVPGQGQDLNGDGDMEDGVAHLHNLATGETVNVGAGFSSASFAGTRLIYLVWETFASEDLDGDGDTADEVLHVRDLATGQTTNLGLAGSNYAGAWSISGDRLLFQVVEYFQGEDLNGDGDTEDRIFHLIDLSRLGELPLPFLRGDSNDDGELDISDPVFNLEFQFLGKHDPGCFAALDTNADGTLDISDPVYNLEHQFLGKPAPPPPFPGCGPESLPVDEALPCETQPANCP